MLRFVMVYLNEVGKVEPEGMRRNYSREGVGWSCIGMSLIIGLWKLGMTFLMM